MLYIDNLIYFLLQLNRVKDRLKQKKINLQYTKEAIEHLGQVGFDPNFGARPVKRVIQQMVENEVALRFLKGDIKEEDTLLIDADMSSKNEDVAGQNRLLIKKLESSWAEDALVANN